ncbi:hypothetical protein GQ55_5G426000 [Panicum hallii var. hallii]|uniref:Uncharacterized protein n=1 Tax=Panicum hallii var. hallii TaxID=1504633 RepID=A0A2T7DP95_9POAL|nr:hypothetical protein GQ55_5G426000 [Panicum hallii var. hallii]
MPPTSYPMTSPVARSVLAILGSSGGKVAKKYGAGPPLSLYPPTRSCDGCDGESAEDGEQDEGQFLRQEVLDSLLINATCSPQISSVEVHTPSQPSPWMTSTVPGTGSFSYPI